MINSELVIKNFENEIINIDGSNINAKILEDKVVVINYQGKAVSHYENDILFTIPTQYAPNRTQITTFFAQNDAFNGSIYIGTNGEVKINKISSNSYGRIIFNLVYLIG